MIICFGEKIMTVKVGVVKWFNDAKGFGFITPDEGENDLFVHWSQVEGDGFKSLREGQRVEFEVGQSDKGPVANGVRSTE